MEDFALWPVNDDQSLKRLRWYGDRTLELALWKLYIRWRKMSLMA